MWEYIAAEVADARPRLMLFQMWEKACTVILYYCYVLFLTKLRNDDMEILLLTATYSDFECFDRQNRR